MHGGTINSGRWCTCGVLGAYWISWNSGCSNTTCPGVVARLRPTSKADSSDSEIWPLFMSASILARPLVRLSPLVSISFCCASGLVARKLAGDMASMICCTAKRIFCFCWDEVSTVSTMAFRNLALSRYDAALNDDMGLPCQADEVKRRSATSGDLPDKNSCHKSPKSCRYWFFSCSMASGFTEAPTSCIMAASGLASVVGAILNQDCHCPGSLICDIQALAMA